MNFALGAIILIILLAPGSTILYCYYNSFKTKESNKEILFTELLLKGLILSFFIHAFFVGTFSFFRIYVDLNILYSIITGDKLIPTGKNLRSAFADFALYNFYILSICAIMTKKIKQIIYQNNLDINFHALTITNYWYHIFSARYLDGRGVPGTKEETDIIFIDVLVEKNDMIYSGFLKDFNYSPRKDELENIVLSNATVRKAKEETETEIAGDVFIIPMSKIQNINVYYFELNFDISHIQ